VVASLEKVQILAFQRTFKASESTRILWDEDVQRDVPTVGCRSVFEVLVSVVQGRIHHLSGKYGSERALRKQNACAITHI